MPSVKLDLGKFVSVRGPRQDGTYRVLFEVPARLRPSGWPSTRPLPTDGRRGDLTDAAEVHRIQADAARLYDELMRARGCVVAQPKGKTIERLVEEWHGTQQYKALKPRTQRGYEFTLSYIRAWAALNGDPDPTTIEKPHVERFLASFDSYVDADGVLQPARQTTKRMAKVVLKMVMDQAIDLKWRADNPVARISVSAPDTCVAIWEADDVEIYAWAALAAGQPDMAALILTEWEIGQRLTDAYLFRDGEHYKAAQGLFEFAQGKTEQKVAIPVSDRLRGILGAILTDGKLYLFHDARTGRPFARLIGNRLEPDDNAASKLFAEVRKIAVKAGARPLQLKWLRHSCVVQQARAGCTVPEIASITGHSIASVETILQKYLPRDSQVARNAQVKRGLVARRDAG